MKSFLMLTCLTGMLVGTKPGHAYEFNPQHNEVACYFQDRISIFKAPTGSNILAVNPGGLKIDNLNDTSFILSCSDKTDGTVIVKVGIDDRHYAEVSIHESNETYQPNGSNKPDIKGISSIGGYRFDAVYTQENWSHYYGLKFSLSPH